MPGSQPDSLPIIENCHGCGACCFHMGYPAFNVPTTELLAGSSVATDDNASSAPAQQEDRKRWNAMPAKLRSNLQKVIRNYDPPAEGELDGPCVWLDPDTRLCRHHLHRPQVCRDFEIGCKQCHDWRVVYQDRIRHD